jgi:hypothetical protein
MNCVTDGIRCPKCSHGLTLPVWTSPLHS